MDKSSLLPVLSGLRSFPGHHFIPAPVPSMEFVRTSVHSEPIRLIPGPLQVLPPVLTRTPDSSKSLRLSSLLFFRSWSFCSGPPIGLPVPVPLSSSGSRTSCWSFCSGSGSDQIIFRSFCRHLDLSFFRPSWARDLRGGYCYIHAQAIPASTGIGRYASGLTRSNRSRVFMQ